MPLGPSLDAPRPGGGRVSGLLGTALGGALAMSLGCGSSADVDAFPHEFVASNLPRGIATQRLVEPDGLRVESITYQQDETYLELSDVDDAGLATSWFGVLVNDSDSVRCPRAVELTMRRFDGSVHMERCVVHAPTVYLNPNGSRSTTGCLSPGEQGAFRSFALLEQRWPEADVQAIEVITRTGATPSELVEDAAPPVLGEVAWTESLNDAWRLSGTLTAGSRRLVDPQVDFFVMGEDTLARDHLSASPYGFGVVVEPGESWEFISWDTTTERGEFLSFIRYQLAAAEQPERQRQ